MTASVNGIELSYTDVGDGVPLVCLHGGMGIDGASLRVPGVLKLAECGIRVIIPDQRGHGASGRASPAFYTHAVWIDDAYALMQHLGVARAAVLGHSYGGFLALGLARRWPGAVARLILIGSSAGPVQAQHVVVDSDDELRANFRRAWPRYFSGTDKHWALFESLAFSAEAYNAAFGRELPHYDLRAEAPAIRAPTLLLVGGDDWYRSDMEWLSEHLPHACLKVFDGVSHFPFIEAEQEFLEAVAGFLV